MNPIDLLTEPLGYAFMQRALLVTVIASIVCAVLSSWLILIGWSLMGDAVSHAVLPGVVIAYALGVPFALGALAFGGGAVFLIGVVRGRSELKEDAAIGIVFTSLFALGLVLISIIPSQVDLQHILFGNLLGTTSGDMWQVVVVAAVVLTTVVVKRRDLTLFAFDPVQAHTVGLSVRRLNALLLGLLALTVVVALQAVGVILVVAMLIIPGATSLLLTRRLSRMLWAGPLLAAGCAVLGLYISYYANTSSGGMVVLIQGLVFFVVFGATRFRVRRQALQS
ncbi:metal ABC transporter permease [Klugiella xanthotipulae]|uniref:Manganese transport system permease protein n=1 Tax=Klugiella xanthotipulae TaxID=244735 RepID=A0A543HRZ7_9MICO|nr:metal ABC transporter permease [Klugiella xanthotipulae]TQM61117.1 manganese transport system permease protein [Klugiella xanthotipulae]